MADPEGLTGFWEKYMGLAIQQAQEGKTPFGCVIVEGDKIISQAFNTISQSHDPTAHGEINAIRNACSLRQSTSLPEATLFTTGEPCPMCMSAILFAKIPQVVFGASISTIAQYMPQIKISSHEVAQQATQTINIFGPFREEKCIQLLTAFS